MYLGPYKMIMWALVKKVLYEITKWHMFFYVFYIYIANIYFFKINTYMGNGYDCSGRGN